MKLKKKKYFQDSLKNHISINQKLFNKRKSTIDKNNNFNTKIFKTNH